MNNGSCEFESHLGHQKVVGVTTLATFSFYPHSDGFVGLSGKIGSPDKKYWGEQKQKT